MYLQAASCQWSGRGALGFLRVPPIRQGSVERIQMHGACSCCRQHMPVSALLERARFKRCVANLQCNHAVSCAVQLDHTYAGCCATGPDHTCTPHAF